MFTHRNAAAVIGNATASICENRDLDDGAVSGHGFVDSIVDDLIDQMMQARRSRRPDVHTRSLTYRFEPFENLNGVRIVIRSGSVVGHPAPSVGVLGRTPIHRLCKDPLYQQEGGL